MIRHSLRACWKTLKGWSWSPLSQLRAGHIGTRTAEVVICSFAFIIVPCRLAALDVLALRMWLKRCICRMLLHSPQQQMICLEDWLMIWQHLWNGARKTVKRHLWHLRAQMQLCQLQRSKRFGCKSRFLTEGLVRDLSKLTLVTFVSSARKWDAGRERERERERVRASIVLWRRSISTLWLLAFSAFVAVSSINLGFKTRVLTSVVSLSDWVALICQ